MLPGNKFAAFAADGSQVWVKQHAGRFPPYGPSDHHWEVVDLDGDSQNEVLFVLVDLHATSLFKLICYNTDGTVRWEFRPGAAITWNGIHYLDRYQLGGFAVGRLKGGKRFVAVYCTHQPYMPSQVAVLDPQGKVLGEYWHTGYLFSVATMDFDGDGTDEVVVGGVNNHQRHRACLAVFSHDIPRSISPVPEGFAPGFASGRERSYILFPRSDLADIQRRDSRVRNVRRASDNELHVTVEIADGSDTAERLYSFNRRLEVIRLDFLQSALGFHHKFRLEGKLDHDFGPAEAEALKKTEWLRSQSVFHIDSAKLSRIGIP